MSELCKFAELLSSYCWLGFRREGGGFEEADFRDLYAMLSRVEMREKFARRGYTEVCFVGTANKLWGLPLNRAFSLGGRMWFVGEGGSVALLSCEIESLLDKHSPDRANCEAAFVCGVIPFRGW